MAGLVYANNFQIEPPQLLCSTKDLTKDTKFLILGYLSIQELAITALINKEFSILWRNDTLWEEKLSQRSFFIHRICSADYWNQNSKLFEVNARQLAGLFYNEQISYSEREQAEQRIKQEIKIKLNNFLNFANSQDKERSLSSLCHSMRNETCTNIACGHSEEISSFTREHLSFFFDSFDTLIVKNNERNDRWYTIYKNIILFYKNFPSLKDSYLLEKLLFSDGKFLTGQEMLNLEWSCERLYILFSFFQQDPELGAQINKLMKQHEDQKKASLRCKILSIILILGVIGLSIGLYKKRRVAIPFPQAKL